MDRCALGVIVVLGVLGMVGCSGSGETNPPPDGPTFSPLTFTFPNSGSTGATPSDQAAGLSGTITNDGNTAPPKIETPPIEPPQNKDTETPGETPPGDEKQIELSAKTDEPVSYTEELYAFKIIQNTAKPEMAADIIYGISKKDICGEVITEKAEYQKCWQDYANSDCKIFFAAEAKKECVAQFAMKKCGTKESCLKFKGFDDGTIEKVMKGTVQPPSKVESKVLLEVVDKACEGLVINTEPCLAFCQKKMASTYICDDKADCINSHFGSIFSAKISQITGPTDVEWLACDKELAPDAVTAKLKEIKSLAADKAQCPTPDPGTFNFLQYCGIKKMKDICGAINASLQGQCQATVAWAWCKWNSHCMEQRGISAEAIKLALGTAKKEFSGNPEKMLPYLDVNDQFHSPLLGGGIPKPFGDWTPSEFKQVAKKDLKTNPSSPVSVCVAPPITLLGKNTAWITGVAVRTGDVLDDLQFACNTISFHISQDKKGFVAERQQPAYFTGGWMKGKGDTCDVLHGQKWESSYGTEGGLESCDGAFFVNDIPSVASQATSEVLAGVEVEPAVGKIRFVFRKVQTIQHKNSSDTPPFAFGESIFKSTLACSQTIGGGNMTPDKQGTYHIGTRACSDQPALKDKFVCPDDYVVTDARGGYGGAIDSIGLTCTKVVQPFLELKKWDVQ